jgi:hypothetical protein
VRLHRSSEPCSVRVAVDDATHGDVVVGKSRSGEQRGRGMVLVAYLSASRCRVVSTVAIPVVSSTVAGSRRNLREPATELLFTPFRRSAADR